MKGSQDHDLFSTCVCDLVMESREFEMLLGRIEPDGSRRPGCIDKFQKETSEVIGFVADGAEKRGLYEDAIRLYDLAKVRLVHVYVSLFQGVLPPPPWIQFAPTPLGFFCTCI